MFIAEKIGSDGFEKYIGFADILGFGGICSFIGAMILRGKVRERDGIEGSSGGDCMATCCCLSCSICQMSNHLGIE